MDKIDPVAEFTQEAGELIAQFEEELLNLEIAPDNPDLIDRAFGILHSLKGAGMMFGWEQFAGFIHQVETILACVRHRTIPMTAALVAQALLVSDYLRELLDPPHTVEAKRAATLIESLTELTSTAPSKITSYAPEPHPFGEKNRITITPSATHALTEQFDHLIEQVHELHVIHDQLTALLIHAAPNIQSVNHHLGALITRLKETSLTLRMAPIGTLFKRFRRVVRDLTHQLDKEVLFTISGETLLVDKFLLKELHAPLLHLIRNAIDHGIESPEQRHASEKDPAGKIHLDASHSSDAGLIISLEDDGRGLDREAIYTHAVQQGLIHLGEIPPDQQLFNLIFQPGFSTAAQLSTISGRGFGMAVVKRAIDNLGGTIQLTSVPGQGTKIILHIP